MIAHHHRRAVEILPVLLVLWILQGCAQVSTQSRPVDIGRPSEVETPPPTTPETSTPKPDTPVSAVHEAHAEVEPAVSIPPEDVHPRAGVSASGGSQEAPAETEPAVSATSKKPLPEPETSVSDGSEAPAEVVALLPLPREEEARVKPTPMEPEPTPYVHVVRWKGETLSLIAQWYTASWQNWEVLANANPGIDSDRITIGNRIRVPQGLLKRRKPMPFEFIPPSPGRTRQKSTPGEPRADAEEVLLFGPTEVTARHDPAPEGIGLFELEEIAGKPVEIPEETGLFGPLE